ncbi:uncharacterized protein LOC127286285 [Leptopilina boulardi]|uniref:uncharacterized protein LOC127286285 n=1 Tax=Leptopilina boulardi TaxID=63433 RepID=UPI0021F65A29|nr:uncharacterized protein LOC127286285 [Leptopilina boulardi]
MKYLKVVLLVVIVISYASFTTAEKKPFKNITLNELQLLCTENNNDYKLLTEAQNLATKLFFDSTENCTDFNHQNMIKDLVHEVTSACFKVENMPNKTELETIYQDITTKLCSHYELVNFRIANKECISIENNFSDCLNENLQYIKTDPDDLFFALAMTHENEECTIYTILVNCMSKAINQNCASMNKTWKDLSTKFTPIMKCA